MMDATEWDVAGLMQLSGGYWGTCALHAGVRLDIFTHLAQAPMTAAEVAGLCQADARGVEMLLNAIVSLGLAEKTGELYGATGFSSKFLAKSSPSYMGHIIMHHHHLMSGWSRLHEAVASGAPLQGKISLVEDPVARESFLMGMFDLASHLAPRVAGAVDLGGRSRLLDLGGGPGTYAVHFCLHNPGLKGIVYDLPTTREFAEGVIGRFGLSSRIDFVAGNYHEDPLPSGFDVAWLSHILHSDGPDKCSALLKRAADSLVDGGMLLVQEFILDNDKAGPQFPALFSLNMLVGTEEGRSYSEEELEGMMSAAGLTGIGRLDLVLPNGAGIIAGRKKGGGQQ